MTEQDLTRWLEAYGSAWKTFDGNAMGNLFTQDALYAETPFTRNMRGRAEIGTYLSTAADFQMNVEFGFKVLAIEPALVHWWAKYLRRADGGETKMDGVFLLDFDVNGLCTSLREWWHADPHPSF